MIDTQRPFFYAHTLIELSEEILKIITDNESSYSKEELVGQLLLIELQIDYARGITNTNDSEQLSQVHKGLDQLRTKITELLRLCNQEEMDSLRESYSKDLMRSFTQ